MKPELLRSKQKRGCCPFCGRKLETDFIYSRETATIARNGHVVYLSPSHNIIVDLLLRTHPQSVTRERLEIAVYGYDTVPKRQLMSMMMSHLRKSLKTIGMNILYSPSCGGGWYFIFSEVEEQEVTKRVSYGVGRGIK